MADRIDDLLDRALETGAIPADATPEERAELVALLAGTAMLRAARAASESEAAHAKPVARARFERFVAGQAAASTAGHSRAAVPAKAKRNRLGHLATLVMGARGIAVAAAIGLIAVVAVFGIQNRRNTTDTAAAFEVGDYVQLQGTVEETADGSLELRYELGSVGVDLEEATTAVDDQAAIDPASLKAGDTVLVGGVVGADLRVNARTLALSTQKLPTPEKVAVEELKEFQGRLNGRIVAFALAPNGRGRVTLQAESGRRLLVIIDQRSAQKLVELGAVIGRNVSVAGVVPGADRVFFLEIEGEPLPGNNPAPASPTARPTLTPAPAGGDPTVAASPARGGTPPASPTVVPPRPAVSGTPAAGGAAPALVRVSGVLAAREGLMLRVATDRGPVAVRLRADTRVLVGDSGVTLSDWLKGETAIGHVVTVSGGLESRTGVLVADVVVVGRKP